MSNAPPCPLYPFYNLQEAIRASTSVNLGRWARPCFSRVVVKGWKDGRRDKGLTQVASIVFVFSFSTHRFLFMSGLRRKWGLKTPDFWKKKVLGFMGCKIPYSIPILDLAVRIYYCLVVYYWPWYS